MTTFPINIWAVSLMWFRHAGLSAEAHNHLWLGTAPNEEEARRAAAESAPADAANAEVVVQHLTVSLPQQ